jgi:hypothetical protein
MATAQDPTSDSRELPPAYAALIVALIAVIAGITCFAYRSSRFQTFRETVHTRVLEPMNRRGTLSKEAIRQIPIIRYHEPASPDKRGKIPAISLATMRREEPRASWQPGCSICSEDVHEGVKVRKLPCGHLFHRRCVDKWLMDHASTCPLWYVFVAP